MSLYADKGTWKRVRLGDVIIRSRKQVDPLDGSVDRYVAGGHFVSGSPMLERWGDVNDGQMGSTFRYLFHPGQVLFVSARPYLRKVGIPQFDGVVADKTYVLDAIPQNGLSQDFLPFLLLSDQFREFAVAEATGSMNPRLLWGAMQRFEFALPPLDEQNRIADLFWTLERHARSLGRLVSQVERSRANLIDRVIAQCRAVSTVPLSSVAEIRGGIQKGKPVDGTSVSRPYIRVANVQAGRIDLREVKELDVSEADAVRFALRKGDVLLNEGGDIDKLGRGTVWQGEIEGCLHQNHVFAVRVDRDNVLPEWVSLHLDSTFGRRYFRAAAKRTSNLATINKAQVSAFLVSDPPVTEQEGHLRLVSTLDQALKSVRDEISSLDTLRQSLSTRTFGSAA